MRTLIVAAGVAAALLTGCGSDDTAAEQPTAAPSTTGAGESPSPSTSAPSSAPASEPATGTVITTADSQFGEVLFDSTGQAIYLFDIEETSEAECYDDCADAWPPVLTDGAPVATGRVERDALGTTTRSDGTTQVTYAEHPLYYYAHEGKNEVLCHNIGGFGGLWLALTASGDPAPF